MSAIINAECLLYSTRYLISSYNNTTQSISSNTITAVNFNTDLVNTNWTTSRSNNTEYIAPVAGWYHVAFTVNYANTTGTGTSLNAFASINGGTGTNRYGDVYVAEAPSGRSTLSSFCVVQLNANDYVQVYTLQSNASAQNIGSTTAYLQNKIVVDRLHE